MIGEVREAAFNSLEAEEPSMFPRYDIESLKSSKHQYNLKLITRKQIEKWSIVKREILEYRSSKSP